MYIEKLSYKNFRNLEDCSVNFDKGVNILYGDNGQGKTNILEAIYFTATGRSHRTHLDKDLIKFGLDESYMQSLVINDGISDKIDVHIKKFKKKGIAVNGLPVKKLNSLFGVLLVVIFSPEDLSLVKAGPSERRRFIDMELCQVNPIYYYELGQYYLCLRQRNNLLKTLKKNSGLSDTIFVWDKQLVNHGIKIMALREAFVKKLDKISQKIHSDITNGKEFLRTEYKPNTTAEDFEEKLKKNLDRDIILGSTSVGVHKDDCLMFINDIEVKSFGSQGQQRTASLATKLAGIELIYNEKNTHPVLLLDDVLSELDRHRQEFLISRLKDIQTIITCTGVEDLLSKVENANMYKVKLGALYDTDK